MKILMIKLLNKNRYFIFPILFSILLLNPNTVLGNHQFIAFVDNSNQPSITYGIGDLGNPVLIDGAFEPLTGELFPGTCQASVFIVPKDSVSFGGALADISGSPNAFTVGGVGCPFLGLSIGFVGSGGLVDGQYDVIYDEDQDAVFDDLDKKFTGPNGAINVVFPDNVPPLPASVAQAKSDAGSKKTQAQILVAEWELILAMEQLNNMLSCTSNPVACLTDLFANTVTEFYKNLLQVEDPKQAAKQILLNNVFHYAGIEADPPDSAFMQQTPLEAVSLIDPESNSSLDVSFSNAGNALATENVLAEALLHSLERYQGAENEGDGQWALIHARAIQNFADILVQKLSVSNAALTELNSAVGSLPSTYTDPIPTWEVFRSDVALNGFSADIEAELLSLGLTGGDIVNLEASISSRDYSGFSLLDIQNANNDVINTNNNLVTSLSTLSFDMQPIINDLISQGVADVHPFADAGGPYASTEGLAFNLDGTGSTDPDGSITSWDWDLDLDGDFDDGDASGSQPLVTFNQSFEGLIGLRVTDNDGNQAFDYAWIDIANSNSRPIIDNFAPSPPNEMNAGDSLFFSVSASDPDGDSPLTIDWFVDDVFQTSSSSFNYQPNSGNVGTHLIKVKVSDNNILGGTVSKTWGVAVFELPTIVIDDVSVDEGDTGMKNFVFTVTRNNNFQTISVDYQTGDGTARSTSDYTGLSTTTLNFLSGGSLEQQVSVEVNGDTTVELDENFVVNLSNCNNCLITKNQGLGTIRNDDSATLSIGDVSMIEGDSGTTIFDFPVTLNNDVDVGVSFDFETSDGSATSGSDYNQAANKLAFVGMAGETVLASIEVNGDTDVEPDEIFFVNLSNLGAVRNINFDTFPNGSPVFCCSEISNQFQSQGAIFSSQFGAAKIFSNGEASSPPNGIAGLFSTFENLFIDIVDPITGAPTTAARVDLTLISVGHALITVNALASDGVTILDTVSVSNPFPGPQNGLNNKDPVSLTGPGIARVEMLFTIPAPNDGVGIDDVVIFSDLDARDVTLSNVQGQGTIQNDEIGSLPNVSVSSNLISGVLPLSIDFTCDVIGGDLPLTFEWEFGDGEISSEQNPSHAYSSVGTFTATCSVTDFNGDVGSDSVIITVTQNKPQVSISANPISGIAPLDVDFTSIVSGGNGILTYSWNFGDDSESSSQLEPSHRYDFPGIFQVVLLVTDSDDQVGTDSLIINVNSSPSNGVVGGKTLSIDSTALLVSGAQSFSWMIPVVLSVLGIGLFVFRKTENS